MSFRIWDHSLEWLTIDITAPLFICSYSNSVVDVLTGVRWLERDHQFITVSTDHRMNVWTMNDDRRITLLASHIVHVADVAAMEMIR